MSQGSEFQCLISSIYQCFSVAMFSTWNTK
uniref:Uncharacterized protein n=1 Tax=Arundo donax TaxID=35708 RepID=A0A0A9EEI9_ARUDO